MLNLNEARLILAYEISSYAMSGDSDYTDDWYWLLKDNEAP